MLQNNLGIRSILSLPFLYNSFQNFMGAKKLRFHIVNKFLSHKRKVNLLDVGCGTAEILDFIPSNVNYFGIDFSARYIKFAKEKYGSRAHFYCEDIANLSSLSLPKFDYILLFGVLHHLSDRDSFLFFKSIKCNLSKNGKVLIIDPCFTSKQNLIAKFLISYDRGDYVRTDAVYKKIFKMHFSNISSNIKHRKFIPYTHLISKLSNAK